MGNDMLSSPYENIRCLADITKPTREAFQALEVEWRPELPPLILAAGMIGRSLAKNVDYIPGEELQTVFNLAEKFLVESDDETGTAVATGFLESLLSQSSARRVDFRKLGPLLGDESRKYCRAWDQFTGVVTDGLELGEN
jgi:hypothetical protein